MKSGMVEEGGRYEILSSLYLVFTAVSGSSSAEEGCIGTNRSESFFS